MSQHVDAGAPLRVAVSDRDAEFAAALTRHLGRRSWGCVPLPAAASVERLVAMRIDALVLDLALLGPRAWSYLERVAAELPSLVIIVCTGRSSVDHRVRGLRLGADDWVTKPCHPEELIARLEAAGRRRRAARGLVAGKAAVAGELEIRPEQFQVVAHGRALDLTPREYELVHLLASAEGRVLEREDMYQRIWGYTMAQGDRSVDVFVRKVRSKLLARSPDWKYIHTHFGIGYRFQAEHRGPPPLPDAAPASSPQELERARR